MKTLLFPFQQKIVDDIVAKLKDAPFVTTHPIPTGLGKAHIICGVAEHVAPKTVSAWVQPTIVYQWEQVIAHHGITNLKLNKVNTNYIIKV